MINAKATIKPYTVKIHIAGSLPIIECTCHKYCTDVGLCVTVTPTNYIYKNGSETGVTIGLINYPRFPLPDLNILQHAEALAAEIAHNCDQLSYTIETPDLMHYHYDPERKPMPQ